MKFRLLLGRLAPAVGLLAVASAARAEISTAAITAAMTDINAIGLAVFGLVVGIAVWKWVRRVL